MIKIKENSLSVNEYLEIRKQVGWKCLQLEQAQRALDHSLYIVSAYEDNNLVAMGRIVGDGAVICYVQDLIVIPSHQGTGIGSTVLKCLIKFVEDMRLENSEMMLCLMCAKGREPFYEKHGFLARPTDALGPGMIQYLKDE
ncbi:MAG: GNAT family N-acetyltransferase [Eubacteriales bacterium]|nr:GNAT family N-acetyltransferase [Eubacteriales bacterium]